MGWGRGGHPLLRLCVCVRSVYILVTTLYLLLVSCSAYFSATMIYREDEVTTSEIPFTTSTVPSRSYESQLPLPQIRIPTTLTFWKETYSNFFSFCVRACVHGCIYVSVRAWPPCLLSVRQPLADRPLTPLPEQLQPTRRALLCYADNHS